MVQLTDEQKATIREYITGFKEFLKTAKAQEWDENSKKKTALHQKLLRPEHVERLTEDDFGTIVKSLWASLIWGNKEYLINKILEDNGIAKIRQELALLLFGSQPLEERFDRFKKQIKGLGPSSITEILVFTHPDRCCLWNETPKTVLPFLGLDSLLPARVFKYSINGTDYARCNKVLGLLRDELQAHGIEKPNFIDVNFFLAYIFYEIIKKQAELVTIKAVEAKKAKRPAKIDVSKLTHWDAIGMLVELGNLLGFETYVADPKKKYNGRPLKELTTLEEPPEEFKGIKDIERVDVIWFNKFVPPSCFFEVEDGSNMRDALQRLFQAGHFNAKFFVVSPAANKPKFERWVNTAPYKHMQYNFRSYEELVKFYNEVMVFNQLRESFLG